MLFGSRRCLGLYSIHFLFALYGVIPAFGGFLCDFGVQGIPSAGTSNNMPISRLKFLHALSISSASELHHWAKTLMARVDLVDTTLYSDRCCIIAWEPTRLTDNKQTCTKDSEFFLDIEVKRADLQPRLTASASKLQRLHWQSKPLALQLSRKPDTLSGGADER